MKYFLQINTENNYNILEEVKGSSGSVNRIKFLGSINLHSIMGCTQI